MTKLEQKQALETILFVATKSLSPKQLAEMIGGCETGLVRELVSELNAAYEKTDRVFRIDSVADGLQMHTLPEYKKWAQSLETVKVIKLSPAVMESLFPRSSVPPNVIHLVHFHLRREPSGSLFLCLERSKQQRSSQQGSRQQRRNQLNSISVSTCCKADSRSSLVTTASNSC